MKRFILTITLIGVILYLVERFYSTRYQKLYEKECENAGLCPDYVDPVSYRERGI